MRKGEQLMLEAASKMSGESGTSKALTTIEFADVVESIAKSCMHDTKAVALKKMQAVQDALRGSGCSYDTLMNILCLGDPVSTTPMIDGQEPTELHKRRLKHQSEKLYALYCSEPADEEAQRAMADIMNRYPTLPEHRMIYRSAKNVAIYFDNYCGSWRTVGNFNGSSIAWASNGNEVYLVHFYNNIFDAGMILPEAAFSVFERFHISRKVSAVTEVDNHYGEINLRVAEEEYNEYSIYLDNIKVMILTAEMMEQLGASISLCDRIIWVVIDRFKSNLIH